MADPARYYIDPVLNSEKMVVGLHVERSPSGEWIKAADFEDYKAAQRRNASLEANTKLGIEIAELRSRLSDLEKGIK